MTIRYDSVVKAAVAKQKADTIITVKDCKSCCATQELGWKQWLLVFLPVLLMLILGYYFMKWIQRDGFKLSDALSTAAIVQMRKVTVPDPQNPGATIEKEEPVTEPVPSASRVIAFITGVAAVIVAICLITYYAYFAIAGCPIPDYEQLWKILAGLGIGVIPYGINVWNKNTKEEPAPTGKPK